MQSDQQNLLDDKELVDRVLGGDEAAFRRFFAIYFPRLFRFAMYRLGGDADLAEDVVQITITKVLDKLHSYRGEAALFSWMCTFCRHEIGAAMKRASRSPVALNEDDEAIRAALESLIDPANTPEDEAVTEDLGRLIRVTLDNLPADYGDALEWKYVDGHSVTEIGRRLGRGSKATESLLYRAREAFRDGFMTLASGSLDTMLEHG